MNLIKEYISISVAALETGVHRDSISRCVTGKYKSAGGFIWKIRYRTSIR